MLYAGVEELGKKVGKVYVGVSGQAGFVSRAYGGNMNAAKLVYFDFLGEVGFLLELERDENRNGLRAESVGDYALFIQYNAEIINVWNSLLVKQNNLELENYYASLTSTTLNNYAVFAHFSDMGRAYGNAEVFDNLLVKTLVEGISWVQRGSAGRVGDYAVFMGGGGNNGPPYTSIVKSLDSNLTVSQTNLTHSYSNSAGGENQTYCFTCGGEWGSGLTVEAFNSSLTNYVCSNLSQEVSYPDASGNRNYWIVLQGDTADVYDTSLTKSFLPLPINMECTQLCAFSNKDKYAFSLYEHTFLVINSSLICSFYSFERDYGTGGHGTCLGKYALAMCSYKYVLVVVVRGQV
jgi:hypothetical protein